MMIAACLVEMMLRIVVNAAKENVVNVAAVDIHSRFS